jgi:hypothetical protein
MGDGELKYPQWQSPLREAILEFDREKWREKLERVENLILERFQELRLGTDGDSEREAINDALSVLRIIKRDRLAYPDWK